MKLEKQINGKRLVPLREDGMPDLSNWQDFIKQGAYKNLGDLLVAHKAYSSESYEGMLIKKAISAKKNEIAERFVKTLCKEEISIQTAISILELTHQEIMESKFNP